jgi:hypothetical protein
MGTDYPIFQIGNNGARFTVFVAVDAETALYLAAAIFLGITLALAVYSKVLK